MMFIELKVGKNKLQAPQKVWQEAIKETMSNEHYVMYPSDWFRIEQLLNMD